MFDGLALPTLRSTRPARMELDGLDTINRNLRAFWPMDEAQRVTARDLSPYRNHLTSPVWPTRTTGTQGRATSFAGASAQYLQNSSFVWPGGQHAAVSVWINVPGSYAGSPWDFGGGRSLASGNAFYGHLPYSDNIAYFYYGAVASGEISTSLAAHLNQWIHIAWAASPTRKAIWINGRKVNESGTVSAAVATGTNAYVGYSAAGAAYHQGAMRLLRLRAWGWTDAEVQRLYREPYAGTFDQADRLFVAFRGASGVIWNETLSDGLTATESFAAALTAPVTLADALTGADAMAVAMTGAPALSEALTGADSPAAALAAVTTLAEIATAADSLVPAMTAGLALSDAATLADAAASAMVSGLTLSDALTAADSLTIAAVMAAALAENVAGADSFAAAMLASTSLTDAATLADAYALSIPGGPAPTSRTLLLPARARTNTLAARSRGLSLPARDRAVILPPERS